LAERDIEAIIQRAKKHGEESDPDMEVGDLQQVLRFVWGTLTSYQRRVLLKQITDEVFGGEDGHNV